MSGDVHVQFCERLEGKILRPTHLVILSNKPVKKVLDILRGYLKRLDLPINEEKSRTATAEEGFNFLGYAFKRGYSPRYQKPVTHIYPTPDAIKRIIKKITQLTYRSRLHESVETIVNDLNASLLGWTEYYRHTASSRRFRKVQGHATRRLRRFIMKKKGSRKNGYKELPDEKLYKVYKLVPERKPQVFAFEGREAKNFCLIFLFLTKSRRFF